MLLKPGDERLVKRVHYDCTSDDLFLIVSQTCDLVQGSFESEPWFEVLCLHPLDTVPDGNYRGGKNSRRIEFELPASGSNSGNWYALPYERHLIERRLLLEGDIHPTGSIDDQTLKMILSWLSRRYTRTAFPESFVQRMEAQKKIGRKFAKLNPLVTNVYIYLSTFEEILPEKSYTIELMLVMDAKDFDDLEKYQQCAKICNELENLLRKCKGIDVNDARVESTANVSIEDLKGYQEWDYSYLSFRDPANAATPIEIET